MANKVTIKDIAQACHVSVSTVSLVLNDKPGISAKTRAYVLKMAEKLGYTFRATIPTPKRYNLSTIGMIVKTDPGLLPPSNPFYSQIIAGVDDACQDMGINLLFTTLPVDKDNYPLKPVKLPPFIKNHFVDGLLMVGTFLDETFQTFLGHHPPPLVLVDGYSDAAQYDRVVSDNFDAVYQAVAYLIQNGHRHIGLVGSEPDCYPSLLHRRRGYLHALQDNGIDQSYIANFNVNSSQGEEETVQLLQENPSLTAVFCVNDNVALGALRAAQRLNRPVPHSLSIISYDDTHLATSISPTLTTIHVDMHTMGRAAVHLLALRAEKPEAAHATFTIHADLIARESTAPINNQP